MASDLREYKAFPNTPAMRTVAREAARQVMVNMRVDCMNRKNWKAVRDAVVERLKKGIATNVKEPELHTHIKTIVTTVARSAAADIFTRSRNKESDDAGPTPRIMRLRQGL